MARDYRVQPRGDQILVSWDVTRGGSDGPIVWLVEILVEQDADTLRPCVVDLRVRRSDGDAARGGLPRRLVRELTFTGALEAARPYLAGERAASAGGEVDLGAVRAAVHRERDGRLHGEEHLTALAFVSWAYIEATREGSRPNARVAEALGDGWTAGRVKGQLKQALRKGVLKRTPPGSSGGRLTTLGQVLVDQRLARLVATGPEVLVTRVKDGPEGVAALQRFVDQPPAPDGLDETTVAISAGAHGISIDDDPFVDTDPGVRVLRR